jgi:hypothetical protein
MTKLVLGCVLTCAVLMPRVGSGQESSQQPLPRITDPATAARQGNGEPIYFDGQFYYPSGPLAFFDPNVMVRTGTYQGIAVFTNSTLEPWSIIYLPVGGTSLRPYERLRSGELGGTTGSRTPSYPVQSPVNSPYLAPLGGPLLPEVVSPPADQTVARAGTAPPPAEPPRHVSIMSIPAPSGDTGVWVEFDSARWYHTGPTESYEASRFAQVGTYKNFPVYRDKNGDDQTIFILSAREGGNLTRYSKRQP